MPGLLAISVTEHPSHTLVTLSGECDINNTHRLQDLITSCAPLNVRLVVVDLSGLRYIDVSGVHGLVAAADDLARAGARLMLASPQATVARMFTLTSLAQFIPIHRHLAEALRATDQLGATDPGDPAPCG